MNNPLPNLQELLHKNGYAYETKDDFVQDNTHYFLYEVDKRRYPWLKDRFFIRGLQSFNHNNCNIIDVEIVAPMDTVLWIWQKLKRNDK